MRLQGCRTCTQHAWMCHATVDVVACTSMVLRYKFSCPNLISPLTKIHIQAHKLFWAHTKYFLNTSHILPKYFPILLPNLGHKIIPSLQKAQIHLPCGQNPKSPTKLSLQSPLLHSTSKTRCYTTP